MTDNTETPVDILARLGVTLGWVYLGYKPEKDQPESSRWPHFAYRVTLRRGDDEYSADYKLGIGHVKRMPETFCRHLTDSNRREGWLRDAKAPLPPVLADVVSSLLSDAQLGSESFADYCSNLDLDTDSRKAFDSYLECQGALAGMRRLFRGQLGDVQTAFQDY